MSGQSRGTRLHPRAGRHDPVIHGNSAFAILRFQFSMRTSLSTPLSFEPLHPLYAARVTGIDLRFRSRRQRVSRGR